MKKEKFTAIVLAGGSGKRMKSEVHKQYILIEDRPVLFYCLKAFQDSEVDDIVLVCGAGEEEYCRETFIKQYGINKISAIVAGGAERYNSVYNGIVAAEDADYVLIHDGARPFVTESIIKQSMDSVREYEACVAAVPVKDTIKIVGEDGYISSTPDRRTLWAMQTPQSFKRSIIEDAYKKVVEEDDKSVTDDAMVLEKETGKAVKIIEGDYRNIKITTPEDLIIAQAYLNKN